MCSIKTDKYLIWLAADISRVQSAIWLHVTLCTCDKNVTVGAACRAQPMDLWYPLACLPRGCVSRWLLTVRSLLALQSVLVLFRQRVVLVWYLWSTLLQTLSKCDLTCSLMKRCGNMPRSLQHILSLQNCLHFIWVVNYTFWHVFLWCRTCLSKYTPYILRHEMSTCDALCRHNAYAIHMYCIRERNSESPPTARQWGWWNPAGIFPMPFVEEDSCNR